MARGCWLRALIGLGGAAAPAGWSWICLLGKGPVPKYHLLAPLGSWHLWAPGPGTGVVPVQPRRAMNQPHLPGGPRLGQVLFWALCRGLCEFFLPAHPCAAAVSPFIATLQGLSAGVGELGILGGTTALLLLLLLSRPGAWVRLVPALIGTLISLAGKKGVPEIKQLKSVLLVTALPPPAAMWCHILLLLVPSSPWLWPDGRAGRGETLPSTVTP